MRFYVMCFVIFVAGCHVAKRDQAAFDRVTAKRPLLDRVRPIIMDLYPCANDTIQVWMPGQVDSVPYAVPVIGEQDLTNIIDSLGMEYQGQCDEALRKAYKDGRASVKIYKSKPDTLRVTIVDKTLVAAKEAEINRLQGVMKEREAKYAKYEEYKKGASVMILIGLVILLMTIGASIMKKIK